MPTIVLNNWHDDKSWIDINTYSERTDISEHIVTWLKNSGKSIFSRSKISVMCSRLSLDEFNSLITHLKSIGIDVNSRISR